MFDLTLVDHLRMTFGHVIYTHRAHAELAARHARWNRWTQAAEALFVLTAALSSMALVSTGYSQLAVVCAVAGSAAVATLVARLAFDFDRRASAHRDCSARLWHIREQYRAVLADLQDGQLTLEGARERRDVLMSRLQAMYENAPPADRRIYEAARSSSPGAHENALTDEEVDRFLPASLQKGGKSAA